MNILYKIKKQKVNTIVFLAFFILILFLLGSKTVLSANLDVVDGVKITNEKGILQEKYKPYDRIKVNVEWSLKSEAKPGDTFIFKIPKELRGFGGTIELISGQGINLGKGVGNGNIVTFTFSDNIEKVENVFGVFYIESEIRYIEKQGEIEVPLVFEINGKVFKNSIIVDTGEPSGGEGLPNTNETFYKWGQINEKDDNIINWDLRINYKGENLSHIDVADMVKSGHEFVDGSLTVYKGYTNHKTGNIDNLTKVPLKDLSDFKSSPSGFQFQFSNNGEAYMVHYKTRILDKTRYDYSNRATLKIYNKDTIIREVTVKDFTTGGTTSAELKKYKGKLKIIKKDKVTGKLLNGAEFKLYNDENQEVATLITNEKGEAITDNIPGGVYILKEIKAPVGYKINLEDEKIYLNFKKDNQIEKVITNEKLSGNIKITTVDKNNLDKVLEGAEFTLKGMSYNNKDINLKGTTNKDGILEFNDLPFGKYTLTETKAPNGYRIDEKEQEIEIKEQGEIVDIKVTNLQALGKLKILKIDEITKKPLGGAEFQLLDSQSKLIETLTTNTKGEAISKELPSGKYTLKEIKVPEGYSKNISDNEFELNFNETKEIQKVITNKKTVGNIKIIKVDKNNSDKVLEGAEFELKGISENNKDVNLKGTTNKEGILEFKDLLSGKYTLTETKAPKGYRIDEKEQEVEIKSQGEVVEVKVKNEKIKSTSGSGGSSGSSSGTVKPKPENPEEPQEPKIPEPENPPINKEDESPSSKIEDHGKEDNKLPLDENKVDKKKTNTQKEIKPEKNKKLLPKTGEDSPIFNYIFGVILITIGFYLRKNK